MGDVLIPDVDDAVIDTLKRHAERANLSLEDSARDLLLRIAAHPETDEAIIVSDWVKSAGHPQK